MPRMDAYIDLEYHLNMYIIFMEAQSQRDDILYQAFLGTLRGLTYRWFTDLLLRSIKNFEALSQRLTTQHIGATKHRRGNEVLMLIKQGKKETLREYTTRFTYLMATATGEMAMIGYAHRLCPWGNMAISLHCEVVKDLQDPLRQTNEMMIGEEREAEKPLD